MPERTAIWLRISQLLDLHEQQSIALWASQKAKLKSYSSHQSVKTSSHLSNLVRAANVRANSHSPSLISNPVTLKCYKKPGLWEVDISMVEHLI